MPASRIHLIRHGEVHNPDGVLFGSLPHFALSEVGQKMAASAAKELVASKS
jgi:broad specificity phosphatase PhoE